MALERRTRVRMYVRTSIRGYVRPSVCRLGAGIGVRSEWLQPLGTARQDYALPSDAEAPRAVEDGRGGGEGGVSPLGGGEGGEGGVSPLGGGEGGACGTFCDF